MRKIILGLCMVLIVSFAAIEAKAAETILFFAPTRIEISDKSPVQEIRVTNMSSIARSYTISTENIIMSTNGVTARVENFDYSARRMIRFVPNQFEIKPGQRQIIRIMGRFAPDTADGEYHVHLNFLENLRRRDELNKTDSAPDNKAVAQAEIAYSTSIPIIVTKGEVKTDLTMSDLKLGQNADGQPELSMVLGRSGNGQGNAFVEAHYIAPDGSEVMAGVRRSVYVYREIDRRDYSFVLELLNQEQLQKGGKIKVDLYNKNVSTDKPIDTAFIPVQ